MSNFLCKILHSVGAKFINNDLAGESIPVRLFLTPYELTPTYRNINNKFSVKYYLNLVLVDEEDRRYFKQQEITMYRLLELHNLHRLLSLLRVGTSQRLFGLTLQKNAKVSDLTFGPRIVTLLLALPCT